MAFKAIVFLLASFLVVASKVSSNEEESVFQPVVYKTPVKTPPIVPPTKAPSPAPVSAPKVKVLPPVSILECPGLCKGRCKLHHLFDHCMRACTTCCQRCKCVPPGTYGNKEMCGPCYVNMTTHGERPKCP